MSTVSVENGLLSLEEAAEYLKVSRRNMRELCLRRKIRFAKPNYRTWIFRRSDLDEYLNRIAFNAKGVYIRT
jgi:excisionase family DNA binding protein